MKRLVGAKGKGQLLEELSDVLACRRSPQRSTQVVDNVNLALNPETLDEHVEGPRAFRGRSVRRAARRSWPGRSARGPRGRRTRRRPCPCRRSRPSRPCTRVSRWAARSSSSSSRPGRPQPLGGAAGAGGGARARRRLRLGVDRPRCGAAPPPRPRGPRARRRRSAWPAPPGRPGRACRAAPWRGRPLSWFSATSRWMVGGSWNSRRVLVTAERRLPTFWATASWVSSKSSISCW